LEQVSFMVPPKDRNEHEELNQIVGVDDVLPQMLWTLYFLEAQGYKIHDNVLYQDNKSPILLETNGRGSSGKRMRHIAV
jgi:hypothetical protein